MATRTKSIEAIQMLKEDHQKVKKLFDDFEDTEDTAERQEIVETAIRELTVHAKIEEEIFYSAVKEATQDLELVDEAEEEHHVVEVLMEELKQMDASDEKYGPKFTVLIENVRHHIKEEEGEMFPKAKKAKIDFEELAQQMMERKKELMETIS